MKLHPTIPAMLAEQARLNSAAPALIDPGGGEEISYGALSARIEALSAAFAARLTAPSKGRLPRLGIVLPNGMDISIAMLATTATAVAVPFNPAQTDPEFRAQFAATQVDAILTNDAVPKAATAAARALSLPVLRLSPERTVRLDTSAPRPSERAPAPDDTALVLMTSGSTGVPKIVPLSHRNLCCSARDVAVSLDLTSNDRCLVMWEQFHIGGLVDLLLAPLAASSSLIPAGSFDAARFFDLQSRHRATWFQGVPTSLGALARHAERMEIKTPLPDLRLLRSVAAALPVANQEKLEKRFGVPVVRTLGMTEAGPLITSTDATRTGYKPGSVGRSAGPEVAVLSEDGAPLETGQTGQVAVRGENVFEGYENNPRANLDSFRDGWFLTGDLGYVDPEGDLFLTGRAKEIINRGGEKISPNEVESAILEHHAVAETACFALPHATLGEDIACAVVAHQSLDTAGLKAHLAQRLAPHKIPTRIFRLPKLPRNPVGKIDRQALVARHSSPAQPQPEAGGTLTPMERLVAEIWQEELSLVRVGRDDDFASVDGDSLSAVRILVTLETRFGQPLPDDVIAGFATIKDLAAGLEAHGFTADTEAPNAANDTDRTAPAATNEEVLFSGDSTEACDLVASATGRADLRLKLEHITAHLAPADAAVVVSKLQDVKPGKDNRRLGLIERMRMRQSYRQRLVEIARYLPDGKALSGWQRQDLAPGVMLFSDGSVTTTRKDLIVGFSGNRMRLLLPTFRFLAALEPSECDLLLLADYQRSLFAQGVASIGADRAALAQYLGRFCAQHGYQRLLGVGTSGGSLAVLAVGISAGFDAIACVAPASLEKHPDWLPAFEMLSGQHDPEDLPIRIIHGQGARHRSAAEMILTYLPQAMRIEYPHAGKNPFPHAQDNGVLRNLLREWLA